MVSIPRFYPLISWSSFSLVSRKDVACCSRDFRLLELVHSRSACGETTGIIHLAPESRSSKSSTRCFTHFRLLPEEPEQHIKLDEGISRRHPFSPHEHSRNTRYLHMELLTGHSGGIRSCDKSQRAAYLSS